MEKKLHAQSFTPSRVTAGGPHGVDQDAPNARRPTAAGSRAVREVNPPARHRYVAPDDVLQETTKEQCSTPEQGSCDFLDWPGTHDERHYGSLPRADVSPQSRSAWHEHEPDAADSHVEAFGVRYDDYEDQSHDHSDDRADSEDWDDDPIPPRRGEFTFVAAVFGLALLGTAVAFAIIKAGGPNKIIQTNTAFQGNVSLQADAEKAGSGERLAPGEDRSADVPPPASTSSQPVSSAPIFADPTPVPEPGPLAKPAPAARVETLNNPPAVPVPPIPRADRAAPPEAPTLTPASPAEPDQPNAAGSVASQPQSVPIPPATREAAKPSDANGLFNDAATPAAASAPTAPPKRPAPVGKTAATEIASTSPAASGGGYAVQVSSQRNEKEVQSSFRTLQAKYPKLLGGREPMVRRADLGAKGIYYRAMVGPFVSAQRANELCSNLKAAGGNCIVQKY